MIFTKILKQVQDDPPVILIPIIREKDLHNYSQHINNCADSSLPL